MSALMTEVKLNWKNLKFWPDTEKIYFTYSDIEKFPEWPEGPLVEIIAGELYMVPSPSVSHQEITLRLGSILKNLAKTNNLGKVYIASLDVVLSEKDVVDPDVFFISKQKESIVQESRVQGVPDLIIEILSKNRNRDLVQKKQLYEQFQVPEYWVIDPEELSVTIFVFDDVRQKFKKAVLFTQEEVLIGKVLPELHLRVADIFQD